MVGTNDTQQGSPVSATMSNIGAMIDDITGNGAVPIVIVEPLWYSVALGGGTGFSTVNYESGAVRRAAIKVVAAQRGVPVIDLQQYLGSIIGDWKGATAFDQMLRDGPEKSQRQHARKPTAPQNKAAKRNMIA